MIEIGNKIDERYRITSRIAHGGMADVYEAYDIVNRETVAIKIMRIDMMDNPQNIVRFKRECMAAASLNNPNIVKVYGNGIVDGRPYMVNEYVEGRTLRDKLNVVAGHNLAPFEACEVMLQLTSGVQYIHEHGLIHRDIKPDNLFYLSDGSVKIADFGISTPLGEKSKGDAVTGTVYYTAPEILMGGEAGVASDIYSMGIVFYEMLTGSIPFDGATPEEVAIAHIKKHFPEPSKVLSSIPKEIDKIVVKACRKRPEERYLSAMQMHDSIQEAMKDENAFQERKGFWSRLFGFK
ncbi:MAG: serine/threonine protein kinase [Bacilli bacterium]|jgi:serine/threonine-protein kinase|nr:serine/threonine protein kinase [Bacilli bacterium]MCH4210867.1 serine/threonine protein kinase [Bacilli bacterium]MCH4228383.1 serine/threonine protein kinase [Bacilli bacterium]MCH4277930.1 serine/threonine protein kinase [Bacilli bacterium]MCI2054882.1 serine/threonine protein kinase [Bacilli bacterium]